MKTFQALILLTTLVWWLEAKPNQCCSNNLPVIPRSGCMNNGTLWIKENCNKAYSVNPTDVQISDDDTLMLSDIAVIPRNRYCIGSRGTENNTIILVCFPELEKMPSNRIAMFVCMVVSILCLILTLLVYLILPRLRDLQGKCIMATVLCLLIAFTVLGVTQMYDRFSNTSCYFIATSLYYWFLGAFFWMHIVSFHIWRTIVSPTYPANTKRVFKMYNVYGWGAPLTILIIAKISYHIPGDHLKPTWTLKTCWFSDYNSLSMYFHVPMIILLSSNIIMFILSAWALRKQTNTLTDNKLRSKKFRFLLCLKLFLIMGICWIFEPMSMFFEYEFLSNIWFITDFINVLQGLIIFLLLVVLRKRVRRDLARHKGICCRKLPQDWATIPDEDCEELSGEEDKLTGEQENNEIS